MYVLSLCPTGLAKPILCCRLSANMSIENGHFIVSNFQMYAEISEKIAGTGNREKKG